MGPPECRAGRYVFWPRVPYSCTYCYPRYSQGTTYSYVYSGLVELLPSRRQAFHPLDLSLFSLLPRNVSPKVKSTPVLSSAQARPTLSLLVKALSYLPPSYVNLPHYGALQNRSFLYTRYCRPHLCGVYLHYFVGCGFALLLVW